MTEISTNMIRYKCSICGKEFKYEASAEYCGNQHEFKNPNIKKNTIKINKNVTMYKCGVCGEEYDKKNLALYCEKQDTCKHKNLKYYFLNYVVDDHYAINQIEEICSDCHKKFRIIDLEKLKEDEELLRKVFDFIISQKKI